MRALILLLSSVFILAGCASIPQQVSGENFTEITADQARTSPERAVGANVRWGGIIVEVINNEQETWIEVLAMPLRDNARPRDDRTLSQGRFIAKTEQFLDPEIYRKGMRITFIGTLDTALEGKVGERAYVYPVLTVRAHHLWPNRSYNRSRYITPGFWYYGFHPYWRFGYPFYGYGVWHYDVFYPYYPVYGYLHRSSNRLPGNRVRGDFSFGANILWPYENIFRWRNNRYWGNSIYRDSFYRNNERGVHNRNTYNPNRSAARQRPATRSTKGYQSKPVTPKRPSNDRTK